jgi:hypothetical protein
MTEFACLHLQHRHIAYWAFPKTDLLAFLLLRSLLSVLCGNKLVQLTFSRSLHASQHPLIQGVAQDNKVKDSLKPVIELLLLLPGLLLSLP